MPLAINSTYQNVFYDFVLDSIRDTLTTEYSTATVNLAPHPQHHEPFSIKIWGTGND